MLNAINIGISGLQEFSKDLKVIANNTGNMNTPGFKSTSSGFSNMLDSVGANGNPGSAEMSGGLANLNFAQGELRPTGNDLDMAIDGIGLFTLKNNEGNIRYSRAGQFKFNSDGILVNRSDGFKVMALSKGGTLSPIDVSGMRFSPPVATTTIKFSGNLSSSQTAPSISGIKVIDAAGTEHTLSADFANNGTGNWTISLKDGTTEVGTGTLKFVNGKSDPANSTISISYTPLGLGAMPLSLDFSNNVTSFASGSLSTLAMDKQDGAAPGELTKAAFDATGTLVLTYSNGQTVNGARLALGRFDSADAVSAVSNNEFDAVDAHTWHFGTAGDGAFGSVRSGMIEVSNVDLSQEFSNLVITQRGYQASSQIISTANEMLQELFSMKSR
jgi:flagellar hook protein FlgE